MKKLFALVLVLALALSLCACGKKAGSGNSGSIATHETKSGVEVEVLSCAFDYEVMGVDEEFSNWGYTKRDGKVYVNLSLKITNNSQEVLNKDNISGYFEYDELRHDLQYDLASIAPGTKKDDNIAPGSVAIVNMLSLVDEAAIGSDIVVKYTVSGTEYDEKVQPVDTREPLSKKTEVKVGDKFNVENFYDIEVVKCGEEKYLRASDYENSKQYTFGKDEKIIDLVLKVKNNSSVDLTGITGYSVINYEIYKAADKIEVDNNTDVTYLSSKALTTGQEGLVHIYVPVKESLNTEDLAMRFNLAGNCYYCYVK